jgi:hypothetical protein
MTIQVFDSLFAVAMNGVTEPEYKYVIRHDANDDF